MKYSSLFRQIPDYPKKGILFEDVTTYWKDPDAFSYSIHAFTEHFKDFGINKVVGLEARGFVIAAPIAVSLHAGFVPIRKPGKLPAETISQSYVLEYGENTLELHKDAISLGDKILLCDDVLATGGTLEAAESLIQELGGEVVGIALLMEVVFLNGREKIRTKEIFSLYQVQE
ncbi:MAG: adenine phosphoribosyltransferase [Brevinema sp.]